MESSRQQQQQQQQQQHLASTVAVKYSTASFKHSPGQIHHITKLYAPTLLGQTSSLLK